MEKDNIEESVKTTPKSQHKNFFGRLTKRSTKVEPHPNQAVTNLPQTSPMNFAKCQSTSSNHCAQASVSQTLPTLYNERLAVASTSSTANANGKSHGHGFLSLRKRNKNNKHNNNTSTILEAGSLSDGSEVVMRKSKSKQRSPNHNRFSHQFSLCCKTEKKPLTPPVTVRYNSIPDATNMLRRDNLSLNWSLGTENVSISLNSSEVNLHNTQKSKPLTECLSAPESPVTSKTFASDLDKSPSKLSTQTITGGPIRPIAVSACRSRLRLKLYPPEKQLQLSEQQPQSSIQSSPTQLESDVKEESMKRATTPQHMSSPNISTQKDVATSDAGMYEDKDVFRFMSHENIQMNKSSGSGLARTSLMAAHVLSLIPTETARERSYLEGRLGPSSLFGPSELIRVLPNKEVKIFVGTWNMNGQSPPKQLNDFVLPSTIEHVPDLVAIGTQESSPDRFEWEATLQETLGPSHVLFHSTSLGTLHLAIYMRRDLIWYCSAPEDSSMSVRTGTAFRTKGAVAISFCLFGSSMLFVTSHLTAHQQKVKERVSDVKRIINALDLPKNLQLRHKNKDVTQNFDNVFWCGDLNFRLGEPREKLLDWIQNTKFPLPSHLPHGYMHTDQLSSVLADGAAFRGFMEANITFPPTYKYDPGTQHFDTSSKQRAPAYTDRILYKFKQTQGLVSRSHTSLTGSPSQTQPNIQCLLYDSVPSIVTSDHKPVWALFRTFIRAGTDSIPLAAGIFNRDIYLEGMKRRLNNQYTGSSAVCSIQ